MIDDDKHLVVVKNYITSKYGIKFDVNNISDLARNISAICEKLNITIDLLSNKIYSNTLTQFEETTLINSITIGETYFYRDSAVFDYLSSSVIPKLFTKSEPINILHAGCSTGEEPYSVAILLNKLKPVNFSLPVNIYGLDINTDSLKKARLGEYKEWSFRDAPEWLKPKYFICNKETYLIKDEIKEIVNFSYFNIADKSSNNLLNKYNFFDIIFCRNIFIYLDKNVVTNILGVFYKMLKDTGIFITSPGESVYLDSNIFSKHNNGTSSVFNKATSSDRLLKQTFNTVQKPVKEQTIKAAPKKIINQTPRVKTNIYNYEKLLILFKQKKYEQCINEGIIFLSSGLVSKEKSELNILLGKAYYKTHQYDLSLKYFTESLLENNLSHKIYFYMGLVYQEQGNYDLAKSMFQKALYLSPRDIGALSAYCHLLQSMNDNNYKFYFSTLSNIPRNEISSYYDDLYSADNIIFPSH